MRANVHDVANECESLMSSPDAGLDVLSSIAFALKMNNVKVALDCARMLALSLDELRGTDCADYAIEPLASDSVKEIVQGQPQLEFLQGLTGILTDSQACGK